MIAGGHQTEDTVVPEGAFTNGEDVFVRGLAEVVHGNTAALTHGQVGLACQFILRANTGGEQDQVGIQVTAVSKVHAQFGFVAVNDFLGVLAGVNLHAQFFNFGAQHFAATFVYLHRHQARCKFNHVGFQSEVFQRLGRFQTKQTAPDDHANATFGCGGFNGFQVFDGSVNQTFGAILAWNRWYKRIGSRG